MKKLFKNLYEHLKTRKKYNTLQLKYDIKEEELENKILELSAERRIRKVEKDKYEETIKEYMEQIQKLKEKNKNKKEKK